MRRTSFADMNCSIAQSLEAVGEWWTLLILRDAMMGVTRFDQFQARLGIARNVLTTRLQSLVDHGILAEVQYQERPPRFEYVLTAKGGELWTVLTMLRQWGDRWSAPAGVPVEAVHDACGHVTRARLVCSECGEPLRGGELTLRHGPGAPEGGVLPA
ncbi:winged helix-turn-helix transcriptional regulator [Nocardioides nitrophenolicus]|uniref:winged helix-turn-helix transcriptional regulator n=1 Tax=Nocardioides nitrophenolicus TaxID=60489 RepID=UPI00195CE1FC|nr:helix-turn-helix domain-containing protein [Nocardioides nitrophenolicus]MBM7520149.1 DNA-binding HxlR family transcriptional regulator [Nocardioides nitrophenolicus]